MREAVGLIPAAGRADRLGPLPCSKELFPVGFRRVDDGSLRPKAACHYLLENLRLAGVTKAYIVLREGKWDIPAYLGDGAMFDLSLAYLLMSKPFGPPYSVDQASVFLQESTVAFGFPDIIFRPDDAFAKMLSHQSHTNADVVLGAFPVSRQQHFDRLGLDFTGRVREIEIMTRESQLKYTWIAAVWGPHFTRFMHEHLVAIEQMKQTERDAWIAGEPFELSMGEVFRAALDSGLKIEAAVFDDAEFLDIGTPDSLSEAVRRFGRNEQ